MSRNPVDGTKKIYFNITFVLVLIPLISAFKSQSRTEIDFTTVKQIVSEKP